MILHKDTEANFGRGKFLPLFRLQFAFLPVQWPVINQAYVNIARIVVLICTIWQGIIVASPIMPHLCTHFIFHYFLTVLSLRKWSLLNGARYDKKKKPEWSELGEPFSFAVFQLKEFSQKWCEKSNGNPVRSGPSTLLSFSSLILGIEVGHCRRSLGRSRNILSKTNDWRLCD